MATKRDYYEILGVSREASDAEIKKSYRRLARSHHPDANPGDHEAEERFKELTEAYEVLSNPEARRAYDTYGHQVPRGAGAGGYPGADPFGGFQDIFEAFFGDFRGWAVALLTLGVVVALVPSLGDALDPRRGESRLRTVLQGIFVPPDSRRGRGLWGGAVALLGGLVLLDPLGAAQTVPSPHEFA